MVVNQPAKEDTIGDLSWEEIIYEEGIYIPNNYTTEQYIIVVHSDGGSKAILWFSSYTNKLEAADDASWEDKTFTKTTKQLSISV